MLICNGKILTMSGKNYRNGYVRTLGRKIIEVDHMKNLTVLPGETIFHIDITLDHCTEGHLIMEYIKESGFPAIVGTGLTSKNKIELANMNFKTCSRLNKIGILTAITTDHPVTPIQYLPLCAGLSVRAGLPMAEAYKSITINAAKICRVSDRVGSLVPGKDADIAIFDGNPMNTFTKTLYTIINGDIVYSGE